MRNIYQVHLVFSIFPCHENDCAAHFWGFVTKHIDTVCCFQMPLKYLKMEYDSSLNQAAKMYGMCELISYGRSCISFVYSYNFTERHQTE